MYALEDTLTSINLKDLKKRIEVLQTDIRYLEGKCLCLSEQLCAVRESLSDIDFLIEKELILSEV